MVLVKTMLLPNGGYYDDAVTGSDAKAKQTVSFKGCTN
jgi:hypothetical protein